MASWPVRGRQSKRAAGLFICAITRKRTRLHWRSQHALRAPPPSEVAAFERSPMGGSVWPPSVVKDVATFPNSICACTMHWTAAEADLKHSLA